jgi:MFS family permease
MTRKEERELVWLGVEFQPMTPALARTFKVEGPTRDGARGLLVTDVYPSSPAERLGIIRTVILTEAATGLGILALLLIPLRPVLVMLPLLGVALNGTSSVLYGSVAELVVPERRSRAYGLFYTLGIGSGALAPTIYGFLSDWAGVPATLTVIGLVVLVVIPLSPLLRLPIPANTTRAD